MIPKATDFAPVFEYEPEHDWLREHLVPIEGERSGITKCGKRTATSDDDDIWFADHDRPGAVVKCPHCPDVAPRFGDGFAVALGQPTEVFSRDFYLAHRGDTIDNTRTYGRYILGHDAFDTAVPAEWCNDVQRLTGIYPTLLGFVTSERSYTEPVPLTIEAYCLLGWYRQARAFESAQRSIATDRS